jgi:hypothetical protein
MRRVLRAAWVLLPLGVLACRQPSPEPQRFSTPQAAADALFAAVAADDADAVLDVLGHAYAEQIMTPDWDAGYDMRHRIAAAARQKMEIQPAGDSRMEIVLGDEAWPFPYPLLRDESGQWYFDTPTGVEVVTNRRIGRNELTAIAILDAYVDAQIDYARDLHDGASVFHYAIRLASTPGRQDGLYWETPDGAPESPLGPLVKGAEANPGAPQPGDPIRGYYFRVLDRQGPHAPGGAYSYVVDGQMVAGFGLVAYPADPGNSGIMTFVVNQTGRIYQKDLGDAGSAVDSYDPDDSWTLIKEIDVEAAGPPPGVVTAAAPAS